MDAERAADSAKKIFTVIDALKSGKLKVRSQHEALASELLALPTGPTGLPDISRASPEAISFGRTAAIALMHLQANEEPATTSQGAMPLADAQCKLFELFENLFVALTGVMASDVNSPEEIKYQLMSRFAVADSKFFDAVNKAVAELEQFYSDNAIALFRAAKALGGVKAVAGGQRAFGPSGLTAARIAGLYCDTQLIPDPIYPHLAADLRLNARHLQLAIALFYVLALRPLIDARLPEPPVVIFPSFEQQLERNDPVTMAGVSALTVKVVAPLLEPKLSTVDEVFEYARKHEQEFCQAVMRERLFVPPGVSPDAALTAPEAAEIYLRELEGIRSADVIEQMKRLPLGVLIMNGVLERLSPQYHLLENADELVAQPLLSQPVQWHYFERCAAANARQLVEDRVLSADAFEVLRALQDDSLTWLANVPIEGLVELRQNREHAQLREDLNKCIAQLSAAGRMEIDSVTREVRHELEVLIQRQQQAMRDVQARYASKNWGVIAAAGIGAAAGGLMFMPALAAIAGVTAPVASLIGAAAGGIPKLATEWVGKTAEAKTINRSMLGMLAAAKRSAG